MSRDDESAALAQKEQDERRRQENELLKNDPDYFKWLKEVKKDHTNGHDKVR